MNPDRPLDQVRSIKVKLALLVGLSVIAAAVVVAIGSQAGVPIWISLPVTIAGALAVTQWLARGMTAPLREMTTAARRLAAGDYSVPVTATSSDEVGELARSFTTMASELRAVDQRRRQLVATVSHELRTPLAAQRAVLENLVDGVVPPDPEVLRGALAQAERLSTLVEDLLDLSRVDGGRTPLRLAPIRVTDLLHHAVVEARVQGRPVAFEVRVDPPNLIVDGDRGRLSQVVANLLDNGIRHSPPGGSIELAASLDGADRWRLEVSDQGPGIPAPARDRVFARFGTGNDAGGGTGLGLAISAWVCELHGGSIAVVAPHPAQPGAIVRATLPVHPPHTRPGAVVRATLPVHPPHTRPEPDPAAPEETPMSTTSTPEQSASPNPVVGRPQSVGVVPAQPTLLDSVFGRLWPERTSDPQPRFLWGAVAIGVLAAAALPYRGIGVGVLLVLVLGGGLVLSASPFRRAPWSMVSAALCLGLAALVVLRANPAIAILAVLAMGALTTTAVTRARTVLAMVESAAAWVLSGVRGLPLLGRTLASLSSHRLLWPVARTVAVSAVALVLFGGLFASADAVLGSWADALIPDLDLQGFVFRSFVFCFVGGVVLAGTYLALNPPAVDRLALPPGRPLARSWEWQVPLGLVIATFVAFLSAQGAASLGGHDYVQRTTGLTYADYVHQGFGQLTFATALTLLVLAMVRRKAATATARDRLALRLMGGLLCLLTLLVVASALHRMSLYQHAYGYTTLRIFVDGFELWLGLLVAFVLVSLVRLDARWLARAALVSGAVFTLGFGLMNPDGWVATHNIERYRTSGSLDAEYLRSLGDDAAPAIVAGGLPADVTACLVDSPGRNPTPDDVLGWNLGRARSADIRARTTPPGELTCDRLVTAYDSGGGRP